MLTVCITHHKPFPKTCVIPTADRNTKDGISVNRYIRLADMRNGRSAKYWILAVLKFQISVGRGGADISDIRYRLKQEYWISVGNDMLSQFSTHPENFCPSLWPPRKVKTVQVLVGLENFMRYIHRGFALFLCTSEIFI